MPLTQGETPARPASDDDLWNAPPPPLLGVGGDVPARYRRALSRWRRALVGVPLLFAAAAVAVTLLAGRDYVARGSFVAQEGGASRSSLSAIAAQFGISNLASLAGAAGSGASPSFYAELLRSRELVRAVVLTRYETQAPQPFSGDLIRYFEIDEADSTERLLEALERVDEEVLAVDMDRQTGIIRISVTLENRELAAKVARRFLDLVNSFNVDRRRSTVTLEREFTERRSQEALARLRQAEVAVADFQRSNRGFEQSPTLSALEAGLQRRVTLAQQVYVGLAQQFEAAKVEEVRTTPVVTIIDAPEGLVESAPRGTVVKAVAAAILGALLVAALALVAEYRRGRGARPRVDAVA